MDARLLAEIRMRVNAQYEGLSAEQWYEIIDNPDNYGLYHHIADMTDFQADSAASASHGNEDVETYLMKEFVGAFKPGPPILPFCEHAQNFHVASVEYTETGRQEQDQVSFWLNPYAKITRSIVMNPNFSSDSEEDTWEAMLKAA